MQQRHVSDTSVDTNLQIKTHVVDMKLKTPMKHLH